MSRKTWIFLGVIIALTSAIAFHKYVNFSNVPSVEPWDGEADEIVIVNRGAAPLSIHKIKGEWVVGDKNIPADTAAVSTIESKMKELAFSELVTRKKFYERFDLSDSRAIRITVKREGSVLRDVLIGKKSSVGDLSYVKLPDQPEVYIAGGNLAAECDRNTGSIRSKTLLALTVDAIESVTVRAGGETYTLSREQGKAQEKKDPMQDKPTQPGKWIVAGRAGEANQNKVNEFLSEFASVAAQDFPEESEAKTKSGSPIGELTVNAKGKKIVFTVYGKNDRDKGNTYLCKSTELPYFANVAKWKVERLLKKSGDLFKK
jgi:hypothetical protein